MAKQSSDDLFLIAILAEISELNGKTLNQLQETLFALESEHDIIAKFVESDLRTSSDAIGFLEELKLYAPTFYQILKEETD